MNIQNQLHVIEMLHAIKIFVETAKKLTDEDIKCLEQVAEEMKKADQVKDKEMTLSEIEKVLGYPVKIVKGI